MSYPPHQLSSRESLEIQDHQETQESLDAQDVKEPLDRQDKKAEREEKVTVERKDVVDDQDLQDHQEMLLEARELDQSDLLEPEMARGQDLMPEPLDWRERAPTPSDQNLDLQDLLDQTDARDHVGPSETVESQGHQE